MRVAAGEAFKRIVRLRRELALNPPIPADTVTILETCTFHVNLLCFRYDVWTTSTTALQAPAIAKRFPTPDQVRVVSFSTCHVHCRAYCLCFPCL